MEAKITKKMNYPNVKPTLFYTIRFDESINLKRIFPFIKLNPDAEERGGWLGSLSTKWGTVQFSSKTIQILHMKDEGKFAVFFIPLIEKCLNIRVVRKLTEDGEHWVIKRKKSLTELLKKDWEKFLREDIGWVE